MTRIINYLDEQVNDLAKLVAPIPSLQQELADTKAQLERVKAAWKNWRENDKSDIHTLARLSNEFEQALAQAIGGE